MRQARPITPARRARLAAGLSLEQAATRAKLRNPRSLGMMETGYRRFKKLTAERLSRAYGCDLDVFLPQHMAIFREEAANGEYSTGADGTPSAAVGADISENDVSDRRHFQNLHPQNLPRTPRRHRRGAMILTLEQND